MPSQSYIEALEEEKRKVLASISPEEIPLILDLINRAVGIDAVKLERQSEQQRSTVATIAGIKLEPKLEQQTSTEQTPTVIELFPLNPDLAAGEPELMGSSPAELQQSLEESPDDTITAGERWRWTHDLHEQFVEAVKALGGPYASSPNPIRDYMGVEGLTANHVASYLQRYRKKFEEAQNRQPSQIGVMGGISVPPPNDSNAAPEAPNAALAREET